MGFVFGEGFGQVPIFLGDLRHQFFGGIEGSEKFRKRKDRIDMEDVDLIVRANVVG